MELSEAEVKWGYSGRSTTCTTLLLNKKQENKWKCSNIRRIPSQQEIVWLENVKYIMFQDNKRSGLQPLLSTTRKSFLFQHLKGGEGKRENRRESYRNPEGKS